MAVTQAFAGWRIHGGLRRSRWRELQIADSRFQNMQKPL